jgi:PDZ domain
MQYTLRSNRSTLRSLLLCGLAVAFSAYSSTSLLAQDPQQTKTQVVVVTGTDASADVLKKLREQLKDLPEEQRDKILKQVETSLEQAMKSVPKANGSGTANSSTTESKSVTTTQTVIVNADGKAKAQSGDGKTKVYEQRRVVVVPKTTDGKNASTESNQTTLTVTVVDDSDKKSDDKKSGIDTQGKDGKKIKEFKIFQGGPNGILLQRDGKELDLDLNNLAELKNMIPKAVQGQALAGMAGPSFRIGIAVQQSADGQDKPNEGLIVERVMEDSPASQAGVEENDVIIKINGNKAEAFTQLQEAVQQAGGADKPVEIVLDRDGKVMTVQVKPMKSEEAGAYSFSVMPQAGSIVSGEELEGLQSGVFSFGQAIPMVPGMQVMPGFQGGLAIQPVDNSELKSQIASLREEVSELKGMLKKLLKEVSKSEEK